MSFDNKRTSEPNGPGEFCFQDSLRSQVNIPSSSFSSQTFVNKANVQETSSVCGDMKPEDVQITNYDGEMLFSDDDKTDIYLSVNWTSGKLGASYYDCGTCQINILADTADDPSEFLVLHKVIQMTNPVAVIASSKQDDQFLNALKRTVTQLTGPGTNESASVFTSSILQLVPSSDFEIGACKSRILKLNLPGMPQVLTENDQAIFIASLLDMNNIAMVRALGALLKYLDRKRINVELEDVGTITPIASLSVFVLKDLVTIDNDTCSALQIFRKVGHPSAYKMNTGVKEGLSLYGIFNQCKSSAGSQFMHMMFIRPTRNMDVLKQRHLAIEYFMNPNNAEMVMSLQNCLKNMKHISKIIATMNDARVSISDWNTLYKTVYNATLIAGICKAAPQRIEIFQNISRNFTGELVRTAAAINRIIDFEESQAQARPIVKFGVDESLDEKKRTYNGLPDFMTNIAKHELTRLSSEIQQCNVVYLPQLGYLLSIPMTAKMKLNQDYSIPDLDFMFVSNDTVFYKSASTKDLDDLLGDIQNDIIDAEVQILLKLQTVVLENSKILLNAIRCSAELDCLITMANVAKEFNYVQPTLSYENIIIIDKGRHPIQELCVSSFVPNSTFSGNKHGKIKLITGPNASGKSVYLKQVGLIIFMAHIGSYVPAQSASIGLVDAIYSRIHTMESISVGLSTFMIDLNQMALATKCATERSLVLVDEFGKGTSAVDGMALLAACVNYWLAKEAQCPHILVSTHIYGATTWLMRSEQLKFQMLDVAEEGNELVYLYQLKDGEASCSYATHVARQAGVREDIIKRAVEITQAVRQSQPIPSRGDQEHEVFERCSATVEEFENVDLESPDEVQSFLDRLRLQWMKADCKERVSKKPEYDGDTDSIATKTTITDDSE